MNRRQLVTCAAASAALASFGASAQVNAPRITIYVPFPPGGPTDQLARVLGQVITEQTGRVVVVDNRPGGGGQIAAAAVKQPSGDNINVFMGDWAILGSNAALYRKFSYDPLNDFVPVTGIASFPMVLYVNAKNPANSVQALLANARGRSLSYASQGPGTAGHVLGALLQSQTGMDLTHVPYKGSAPAVQDLLSGMVDMLFDALPAGRQHVEEGRLKALAIMSDKRSPLLPNTPTAREVGLENLKMDVWFALVARGGTQRSTITELNKLFVDALDSDKVAARFKPIGLELTPSTPEQLATRMKSEYARWSQVVTAAKISID